PRGRSFPSGSCDPLSNIREDSDDCKSATVRRAESRRSSRRERGNRAGSRKPERKGVKQRNLNRKKNDGEYVRFAPGGKERRMIVQAHANGRDAELRPRSPSPLVRGLKIVMRWFPRAPLRCARGFNPPRL